MVKRWHMKTLNRINEHEKSYTKSLSVYKAIALAVREKEINTAVAEEGGKS